MMKKTIYSILALFLLATLVVGSIGCSQSVDVGKAATPDARLRLATTTSLYDTGLWTYLEPKFEKKYNVHLDILAVGSGAAIKYGQNGDVDVVTLHPKGADVEFVSDNYGVERVPFAYNYFMIVGPESDPAGLKGMTPADAFKKLYQNPGSGKFVSRGDGSGTQAEEQAIWESAGYDNYTALEGAGVAAGWYIDAGSGMGATLTKASELGAYTLTDTGTFLSYKSKLSLVPIVDQGSILLNVYSVIVCTKSANQEMAQNLVDFLTSPEIQNLIGEYGVKEYGMQLFTPCAGNEPTS